MAGDTTYVGIQIQGGLLPAELLSRLSTGKASSDIGGLNSADYGLAHGETVREAANRVWAYLTTVWVGYRKALAELPETDRATSLTRDRWLQILLDQLGYGRVSLTGAGGITIDDKSFPVSHLSGPVPIHLLGERIELDKRTPGVPGAAGQAPQSMVQELLNRTDDHLWAILSNGATLRLLRDSTSLVGSAYVEFDLEAIFEGELFSDFLMLYTLCHQSRLTIRDNELGPMSCWLESWRETAFESGSRALDQLRLGVVDALQTLGSGFLAHPDNSALRQRVESGELALSDYNHSLLRVVYRLLFSFVAEDRGALLSPEADPVARKRYLDYFSTDRLRRTARRRRGGRHGDRWRALQVVWDGLGSPEGRPELGIAGIGGLYEPGELDLLGSASLSNEALLRAVRSLSIIVEKQSGHTRVVDHRNLGAEELGSIYEALLEYVPSWDGAARAYRLGDAAGNTRKTTGSYYTPTSLIESLLDTALDPVLDEAEKRGAREGDPEAALLAVTVCDPACGSGHFLVGAARRVAKRVAKVRTGDPEPPPEQIRSALRDVVGRCIYGVDINPLAAELAKVSLWLEAMEPGKPLAFLDAQIKVGNALIGATPALLDAGIPNEAFKPIEGDDKKVVSVLAKRNKDEAGGQGTLFAADEARTSNAALVEKAADLIGAGLSLADIHVQQQRLRTYVDSLEYRQAKLHADAWCAAFVWPKTATGVTCPTNATLEVLRESSATAQVVTEIERLSAEYRFFHWHLEFPQLFPTERPERGPSPREIINPVTGWYGGFSVVLGNPPWERVKLQEQEFFASRDPEIANARNAAGRKKLIAALTDTNPGLHAEFVAAKRRAEGESHALRNSGRFPLTGRGDINRYAAFAELMATSIDASGRLGIVTPTGLATDATTAEFFADSLRRRTLVAFFDFENEAKIFPGVHNQLRFALTTMTGGATSREVALASYTRFVRDLPSRQYALAAEEVGRLNPNTGTLPLFRTRRDAEITLAIYRRFPILISEDGENPWGIQFLRMFDMANDSASFSTAEELEESGWVWDGWAFNKENERQIPLYEAKMVAHFDHRFATYHGATQAQLNKGTLPRLTEKQHEDPSTEPVPLYWVSSSHVDAVIAGRWSADWVLGFRGIGRAVDFRTFTPAIIPLSATSGKFPLALTRSPRLAVVLHAVWSSYVFDFVVRQKLAGTDLALFVVSQLACPTPEEFDSVPAWTSGVTIRDWLVDRLLELVFTSSLMSSYADAALEGRGAAGAPFRWDPSRRELLRAEVEAAMLHLFGLDRSDAEHVMDSFFVARKYEVRDFGEFRSKRMILEAFDAMALAIRSGTPFQSSLIPPPGMGARHELQGVSGDGATSD